MTCKLTDGIHLHFLRSGIKVRAYEVDLRSQREHFSNGQFVLSREAGELIHGQHDEYEPVQLVFDGTPAYRLFIDDNAISFQESLDETDQATLTLKDASKVLQKGEVSFTTDSINISDAVRRVVNKAIDKNNVIEDIEFTDNEVTLGDLKGDITPPEERIMGRDIGNEALEASDQLLGRHDDKRGEILEEDVLGVDTVEKVLDWWADILTNSAAKPNNTFGGFDFDGVSPLTALKDVLEEWEYNFWVTVDGTLTVGRRASAADTLITTPDNDKVNLSDYNVTGAAERTSAVFVRGPYITESDQPIGDEQLAFRRGLEVWARAEFEGLDGTTEYYVGKKSLRGMEDTEEAAGQMLLTDLMNQVHGSAEINGLSSTNTESIAKVAPGDTFIVDPQLREKCASDLTTGPYLIEHVKHNADTSSGWTIDLDLSRIPGPGLNFTTSSMLYDPVTGKRYEDFEAFKESTFND